MTASILPHTTLPQDPPKKRLYQGVTRCRICHKKPEQGNQYGIWRNSAHARAYTDLGTPRARSIASKKGISDPQRAEECLACHATGYANKTRFFGPKYKIEDGVGCESCHGAGSDYFKKKTMIAVLNGELKRENVGLIIPDEADCRECHNRRSPTFKAFDFESANAQITHPVPDSTKQRVRGI